MRALASRGHVEHYEKELRRQDGSPLFLIENAMGIFNENGDLVEIHGFVVDETKRIQIEQQLRQVQKMQAIGGLAGGIAHDFNNILAVVNGYSEMLLRDPSMSEGALRRTQEILKAGQHAASLTRQLLAFSRKQMLQPTVLNLNLVIKDIDKMLRRLIREDIELKAVLAPDLMDIMADRSQMEQVLLNFCINARDAMPDGGTIIIETKNVNVDQIHAAQHYPLKPGQYVRLSVSDTGIGMEKEILSHVFEPFFTTKGPDKGTGLGLATVYGIVEQSGGHVWAYSEPGQGATFSVYLPTVLESMAPLPEAKREEIKGGSETILLVEDAAPLRWMTRELLENKGYKVLEANDGDQALQVSAAYAGEIALLLTDVVLPTIPGTALAEKLKRLRNRVKILFMSGYVDGMVHAGKLAPGSAFLQKPFGADELTAKIRALLDGTKSKVV